MRLPRSPHRFSLLSLLTATVLFILLLSLPHIPLAEGASPRADDVLEQAWMLAEQSGRYNYRSSVAQTTFPAPTLANAGRAPEEVRFGIEGAIDLLAETMEMTLWPNGSFDPQRGVTLRVEDGVAYGRAGNQGEWEPVEGLVDLFAPGGDPLGFLAAAQAVTYAGEKVTSLGSDSTERTFRRYTFRVDGGAFGAYMKEQLQAQLRARGELPPGVTMDTPAMYTRMTGEGEIWLREDGLPAHMSVALDMPLDDGQQVNATLANDYWNFDKERLAQTRTSLWQNPAAWVSVRLPQTAAARQELATTLTLILLLLIVAVIVKYYWRNPKFYAAVVGAVILSMVVGPLMRSERVQAAGVRRDARVLEQETRAEEVEVQEAAARAARPSWNPQRDPLAAPPLSELAVPVIQATPVITSTDTDGDGLSDYDEAIWRSCPSLPSVSEDCTGVSDSTDTDGDGLTDGVEVNQLNTFPAEWDSDGDAISDTLEVQGWEYNGTTWYSNPNEPDTNFDGRTDGEECPDWSVFFNDESITTCPDTDGDGTPDMFDGDNDGDGVPDDADLSPEAVVGPFNDANPFALAVEELEQDKPVIVTVQFRPTYADNLFLQNVVLDWPGGDLEGHLQRTQNTTFATTNPEARASDALAGNGDVRLVPLLEITMPYSDGHYANLPVLDDYAGITRTLGITVGEWLDQAALDPFGISVNDVDESSGDLVAYLPLTTETSQSGDAPVAFNARMLYWPSQAGWGADQEFRVVWLVQMLQETDTCYLYNGSDCVQYEEEVTTVHVYDEEWDLTGLNVSEEHGTSIALLYENPAQAGNDAVVADSLWQVAWNLTWTFLEGRDCDSYDGNDQCIGDGERDVTIANMANTVADWGSGTEYVTVVTADNPYDHYFLGLGGAITNTTTILTDTFAAYQDRSPTIMTASESTSRSLNLNDSADALDGSHLVMDLDPATVLPVLSSGMSWQAYQYDSSAGWQAYDSEDYLTLLEANLASLDFFQPDDESENAAQEAEGKLLWAQSYYTSLLNGLTNVVELDNTILWTLDSYNGLPDRDIDGLFLDVSVKGINLVGYAFIAGLAGLKSAGPGATGGYWKSFGSYGSNFTGRSTGATGGGIFIFAVMMFVVVTLLFLWVASATGNTVLYTVSRVILSVMTVIGYTLWTLTMMARWATLAFDLEALGVHFLTSLWQSAKTVSSKFNTFPKASLLLTLGIIALMFVYMMVTADLSNPFNVAYIVVYTIISILYALILFAISAIPIIGPIIVAFYYIVDAIFLAIGLESIQSQVTEALAELLISDANEFLVMDDPDRLDYDFTASQLANPEVGFVVGNAISLTMDITNTITSKDQGYIADAEEALRQSAFDYQLRYDDGPIAANDLPEGNSMRDRWTIEDASGDNKEGTLVERDIQATIPFQDTGINRDMRFRRSSDYTSVWITEEYAVAYSACVDLSWLVLYTDHIFGAEVDPCFWGHSISYWDLDIGSSIRYDVLPDTVQAFYALTWNDADSSLQFPQQRDHDGDGLLSNVQGGSDSNDSSPDSDGDGLLDSSEPDHGTPMTAADGDGDGLTDGWELIFNTDPYLADSDSDGLSDYTEKIEGWIYAWQDENGAYHRTRVWSDPLLADEDEDSLNDLEEFVFGTHPQVKTDPSFINEIIRFDNMRVDEETHLELLARFEEDSDSSLFADQSGNDYAFTCVDESSCPFAAEAGRYGKGVRFVTLNHDALVSTYNDPDLLERDFTIALWVKDPGYNHRILSWSNNDGSVNVGEAWLQMDNFVPEFSSRQGTGYREIRATEALTDGAWHHLAVSWDYDEVADDGTGVGTFWVDGVDVTDPTSDFAVLNAAPANSALYLSDPNNNSNALSGTVDELALWDTVLSTTDVQATMAGRYNPNDLVVLPGVELSYTATITNTHPTQGSNGHVVATSDYYDPEMANPVGALRFERQDKSYLFENGTGEASGIVCYEGSCPSLNVTGKINRALQWDGINDSLWLENALHPGQNKQFMSFWLYVSAIPAEGERDYLLDTAADTDGALDIYLNDQGQIVFDVAGATSATRFDQAGGYDQPWSGPHSSSFSFNSALNTWTYVQWTYNSNGNSGETRLWINTIDENTDADSAIGYSTLHTLVDGPGTIGNSVDGEQGFVGRIDQWVFYNNDIPPRTTAYSVPFNYYPWQLIKNGTYWTQSNDERKPDAVPTVLLAFEDRTSTLEGQYYDYFTEGRSFGCQGTTCPAVESAGAVDEAARFDGTNDLLTRNDLDIGRGDVSVSLWFTTIATDQTFFAASDESGASLLLGLDASGQLRYSPGFSSSTLTVTGAGTLNDGAWHHLLASYESDTQHIYVDGVQVASSRGGSTPKSAVDVSLGGSTFNGALDELVLIPGAVDAAGVQLLMSSQYPIIRPDEPFLTFEALSLERTSITGTLQVSERAASSRHRITEEVEAALQLSQDITIPVVDSNAADLTNFFPFEEVPGSTTWEDVVNPVDATCAGTSCPTAGLRGYVDRAAYFDGVDDALEIDPNGNVSTIAVWVKADGGTIWDTAGLSSDGLELDMDRFRVTWYENNGGGGDGWFDNQVDFSIPDNVWTHIVAVHDQSASLARVYINGTLVGTVEAQGGTLLGSGGILGRNLDGNDFLHGYLDDLRLYGVALSASDVATLYTESAALMRWEFDEPEEATAFEDRAGGAVGIPANHICLPVTLDELSVEDATGLEGATLQVLWEGATLVEFNNVAVGNTLSQAIERTACGGEQMTIRLVKSDETVTDLRDITINDSDITGVFDSGSPMSFTGNGAIAYRVTLNPDNFTFQPNPAPGSDGKIGNTALFNGEGYVEVTGGGEVAALTEDFTVMAWVNPESITGTHTILASGQANSANGWGFGVAAGTLFFEQYGGTRTTSDVVLDANVWQQVALKVDSSNVATFYLDGIAQYTTPLPGAVSANSDDPLYLGAGVAPSGAFGDYWDGELDEMAVYRRALTDPELFSIYLRELRWYRAIAYNYVTVDKDAPTIALLTDSPYRTPGYIQLGLLITDARSSVGVTEWGMQGPNDSTYAWDSMDACVTTSLLTGDNTWCPNFTGNDEGAYQFQVRALDVVGNEAISGPYTLYVDGSAPQAEVLYSGDWLTMTESTDSVLSWTVALSGTVSDPDLPGGIAGSGVYTAGVTITLTDSAGMVLGDPNQYATLDGDQWSIVYEVNGTRATGVYTIGVNAQDNVGNAMQTEVGSITLDTRAPLMDVNQWQLPDLLTTRTFTGTLSEQPDWGNEVARYHFESATGTIFYDSGDGALDLSCSGTTCPTTDVVGQFGDAITFDGVNDQLRISDVYTSSGPLDREAFTFSLWLKPTTHPTGATNQGLITKGQDINNRLGPTLSTNGSALQLRVRDAACASIGSLGSGAVLTPNVWQQVAASYDGTTLRLYLNGTEVSHRDFTGGVCQNDFDWIVGGYNGSNAYNFAGGMDELRVWDRALSAREIHALGQSSVSGVASGEVALKISEFVTNTLNPDALTWQPVTLAPTGGRWSEWTAELPDDLEGYYTLYGRGTDVFGNRSEGDAMWSGAIDHIAPRINLTVEYLGSGESALTAIDWEADDLILDPTLPGDVCGENEPTYEVSPYLPVITTLRNSCTQSGHTAGPWSVEVCDYAGHCTLETVTAATPGTPRNLVAILSLTHGETLDTRGPFTVSGAALSPSGLDTLSVSVSDGTTHSENWGDGTSDAGWSFEWAPEWGTYQFTATLTTLGGATLTDTISVTVSGPDLSLTKTVEPAQVFAGDAITYTLVLRNDGPGNAPGAWLTDTLPAAVAGSDLNETLTVGAGEVYTFTLRGTVIEGSGAGITNTATLTFETVRGGETVLSASASVAQCGPYDVDNGADSGTGSLRWALALACEGSEVTFDDNLTITLTSPLTITQDVTVQAGNFNVTLDGANGTRLLDIGSGATVTLDGLTLRGGSAVEGGAIHNAGTLIVRDSTFLGNSADQGAALYNEGTAILNWSSVVSNSPATGASALYNLGILTLDNVTVAGNAGGVTSTAGSTLHLTSSLLANNSGLQCSNSGTLATDVRNLITNHSGCGTPTQTGDPFLGTLGNYGGATWSVPLLPGSPAINAGVCDGAPTDQRGEPIVGTCDIGAWESQGFTLTTGPGAVQTTWINTAFSLPLTVTVTANNPTEPVEGGYLWMVAPSNGASIVNSVPGTTPNREWVPVGAGGVMSRPATANGISGSYNVSFGGATFTLTNQVTDLTLTKILTPAVDYALPGELLTYTLSFNNNGNGTASGITLSDLWPTGLELLETSASGVTITPTAGTTYTWTLSELAPGASGSLTLRAQVRDDAPLGGNLLNEATISTSDPESDTGDNDASASVALCAATTRLYVSAGAAGANNGLAWGDALTTLQDALAFVEGCGGVEEIWVTAGTYYPDEGHSVTDDDGYASFTLPAGVALYGGFAGSETTLEERDPALNLTILSGDIGQDDTLDATGVVTTYSDIVGLNSEHVVRGEQTNAGSLLDGFTITGGAATRDTNESGGGLYRPHNGTYRTLHFSGNYSEQWGGALYQSSGSAILEDVRFTGNGVTGQGAVLYHLGGTITLRDVTIIGNEGSSSGAAFFLRRGSVLNASNLLMMGNRGAGQGVALYNFGGTVTITNATFVGNGNDNNTDTLLYNTDSAMVGGQMTLTNLIVWGNRAGSAGNPELTNSSLSTMNVINSLIQSGCVNANGSGAAILCTNVTSDNPLLAAIPAHTSAPTLTGDARLLPGSPARDAGDSTDAPAMDLRGAPRVGTLDIGVYEAQGWTLATTGGDGQSTTVGAGFAEPLSVILASPSGLDPIAGANVTFQAPDSGASLDPASTSTTTENAGVGAISATANNITGTYSVTATVVGVTDQPTFTLTNEGQVCAPVSVTSSADSGAGTLREALSAACDGTTISFTSDMTIELQSTLLIDRPITIEGAGHIITLTEGVGSSAQGIVTINDDVGVVTLSGLRVIGGSSTLIATAGGINTGRRNTVFIRDSQIIGNVSTRTAGGVSQRFTTVLTIERSTIADNENQSSGGYGGGIASSGPLTITHSTIANNTAPESGGVDANDITVILNSTISGNVARSGYGGGIGDYTPSMILRHSTVVNNTSIDGGGGLYLAGGDTMLEGNIIVANASTPDENTSQSDDCFDDGGNFSDGGYNLVGAAGGCPTNSGTTLTIAEGDVWSTLLEPLGDYGGSTETHALMDSSVAIDAGAACSEATDQRGQPRGGGVAQGGTDCDIGAYEAFSTAEVAGDVSCDATMNTVDGLFVLQYDVALRSARYLCPLAPDTLHLPSCDINTDSTCNAVDGLFLLQCDAGLSNSFCPGVLGGGTESVPVTNNGLLSTVTMGSGTIGENETEVTIPITIDTTDNVGAVNVRVTYDSSVVTVTGCSANPDGTFDFGFCNRTVQGRVTMNATSLVGVTGNGLRLATITFARAIGVEEDTTIPLPITINTFASPSGSAISAMGVAGELVVEGIPLAVTLAHFDATAEPQQVLVTWETASEVDNLGFNLLRAESEDLSTAVYLNEELILSQTPGGGQGAAYEWQDTDVVAGTTYWYWLESVDVNGHITRFGPVSATFGAPTAVTLGTITAEPVRGLSYVTLLGLLLAGIVLGWRERRRR